VLPKLYQWLSAPPLFVGFRRRAINGLLAPINNHFPPFLCGFTALLLEEPSGRFPWGGFAVGAVPTRLSGGVYFHANCDILPLFGSARWICTRKIDFSGETRENRLL